MNKGQIFYKTSDLFENIQKIRIEGKENKRIRYTVLKDGKNSLIFSRSETELTKEIHSSMKKALSFLVPQKIKEE